MCNAIPQGAVTPLPAGAIEAVKKIFQAGRKGQHVEAAEMQHLGPQIVICMVRKHDELRRVGQCLRAPKERLPASIGQIAGT